jgi:hypothetical protein
MSNDYREEVNQILNAAGMASLPTAATENDAAEALTEAAMKEDQG